jgi:hypothetical protein
MKISARHLVAGVVVMLMGATAEAQQPQRIPEQNFDNAYVGISGGAILPQDVSVTSSGTVTGSGKFSFKTGYVFMGIGGYHFNDFIAGEVEVGFAQYDLDQFAGRSTSPGSAPFPVQPRPTALCATPSGSPTRSSRRSADHASCLISVAGWALSLRISR